MRRGQDDRVDTGVGERRVEGGDRTQPVPVEEVACAVRVARDRNRKAQPVAFALYRGHQSLSPAAESDDRRFYHGVLLPRARASLGTIPNGHYPETGHYQMARPFGASGV